DLAASTTAVEVGHLAATVLVVEDEHALRFAVSKALRRKGLTVIEAATGKDAVDLFRVSAPQIDVVLLDMTLPGLAGREVLDELRQIQPNVKVIITSAYTPEYAKTAIGGWQPWLFIQKPYRFNALMGLLENMSLRKR